MQFRERLMKNLGLREEKKPLFLVNDLKLHNLPLPVYKYEPLYRRHNYGVLRVGFKINTAAIGITMWNVKYSQHDGQ
jgi:hypothetical protein